MMTFYFFHSRHLDPTDLIDECWFYNMIKRGDRKGGMKGGKERQIGEKRIWERQREREKDRSNRMEVNQIISQVFDTKPLVHLRADRVFFAQNETRPKPTFGVEDNNVRLEFNNTCGF